MVSPQRLFGISIVLSFLAWGVIAARYLWPALREAASFVASPDLPDGFARPAAYGDLIAAVLALVARAALQTRVGIGLVWVFNIWGSADLLHAYYQGRVGVGVEPGQLGAAYFIPTVVVPLLLITHGLVFRLLLQGDGVAAWCDSQRAA